MLRLLKSYPFFFIFLILIACFQIYYRFFYTLEDFQGKVELEGRIIQVFEVKEMSSFGKTRYFHKFFFEADYKKYSVQYTSKEKDISLFRLGQKLKIQAEEVALKEARYYGQSDERFYLISKNIKGKLKLLSYEKSESAPTFSDFLLNFRQKFLTQLKQRVLKDFSHQETALLFAMVLGEQEDIEESVYKSFQLLGLTHILVASGSNLLLVFMLFSQSISSLGNYRKKYVLLLILLAFYTYLSGGDPSIERAFYFALAHAIFKHQKFALAPLQKAALMCTLVLILRPYYVFSIGFLLSSSLALFLSYKNAVLFPIEDTIPKKFSKCIDLLKTYFLCQLLVLPFLASLSSYFSVFAIVLNVLLMPVLEVFLLLAFPYLFFKAFTFPLFQSFADFLALGLHGLFKLFHFIFHLEEGQIPKIFLEYPILYYKQLLFLFPFFLYFVLVRSFKFFHLQRKKLRLVTCLLSMVLFSFTWYIHYSSQDKFSVYFFDVGQGDSAFIHYNHKTFLLDAGLPQEAFKVQKNLDYLSTYRVDLGIVSHEDLDHIGGFEVLTKQERIQSFLLGDSEGHFHSNQKKRIEPRTWLSKDKYLSVWTAEEGEQLKNLQTFNKEYGLNLILPKTFKKEENANSLIVLLKTKEIQILFLGDIGKAEEEAYFLDEEGKCKLDLSIPLVTKIAHHGSKHSSSPKFIKACRPTLAVISAGKNNTYGHPHETVLKLLEEENIPYAQTDEHGIIEIHRMFNQIYYRTFKGHFYGEEKLPWKSLP